MPDLVTETSTLILTAICAYLLGAIPFGIVITRVLGLGDLRSIGSGNIGATNVLRTGHKGAAAATLLLDGAKGAVAVLLARALTGGEDAAQLAGLAAFLGHLYPVWLGFKGGKGVAPSWASCWPWPGPSGWPAAQPGLSEPSCRASPLSARSCLRRFARSGCWPSRMAGFCFWW